MEKRKKNPKLTQEEQTDALHQTIIGILLDQNRPTQAPKRMFCRGKYTKAWPNCLFAFAFTCYNDLYYITWKRNHNTQIDKLVSYTSSKDL